MLPVPTPTISSTSPDASPAKTLIVDGKRANREMLAVRLSEDGHQTRELQLVNRLMAEVEEFCPDLILLALDLPGVSGLEVCGDLRATEWGRHAPIVLYSETQLDEIATARALRGGADDCVSLDRLVELSARVAVQLRNKRYRDVLSRVRLERDGLRVKATIDPLTGIPNRRALEDALGSKIAASQSFGLLFVDIDHFKRVNDRFGHDVGDAVLRTVADYMKRSIRAGDFCGRFGGEEFLVLVDAEDLEVTFSVAERHRQAISRIRLPQLGAPGNVTVSVGAASYDASRPDASLTALVRRADEALYQAKRQGRNCCVRAAPIEPPAQGPSTRISMRPSIAPHVGSVSPGAVVAELPALEQELVRQLNTGRASLPVLPTIASEALQLANDPDANIARFAQLVARDPHFAARFLAMANSAIYSRGVKATSVRDAIVRIGLAGARDLLFQVVYATATVGLPRYQELVTQSYRRSVLSAVAARAISRQLGERYSFDYLCGLLHDIGESRIYRILAPLHQPDVDMRVVGDLVDRYHARAGAELATAWRLPSEIIEVCAEHHREGVDKQIALRLVKLADILVAVVARKDGSGLNEQDKDRVKTLGLSVEQATTVLNSLSQAKDNLSEG